MKATDQNLIHAILTRASEDSDFRQLALDDAEQAIAKVMAEEGYEGVDAEGSAIFVETEAEAEAIDSKNVFVLPKLGEGVTLSEEDLEAVAGGAEQIGGGGIDSNISLFNCSIGVC